MTNIYWIDLFCGAGGTSSGIHLSGNNVKVLACVNHDANAIKSHALNHPETHHFTEDVRDFAVVQKIKELVDQVRKKDPDCVIAIWASLECTNFSKAKGGLPRDADSRTLADHMFMYIEAIDPDYFWVENVREFMAWGPLDEKGKPVSRTNGQDFTRWKQQICEYGYRVDHKILNSADFGAYQSRERLFMQFAKDSLPISWPEQTHTKDKRSNKLFPMPKWKPVREVLDLEDEGNSIFSRKKPLSENTLKRILAGLNKFVAKGETVNSITTENSHAVVNSVFLKKYFSGRPDGKVISIEQPAGTVTTFGSQAIVQVLHCKNNVEVSCNCGNIFRTSEEEYLKKQCDKCGDFSSGYVTFLNTYYGSGGSYDLNQSSPTVTTKDRISKIDVRFYNQFIMNQYSGGGEYTDLNGPSSTVTNVPKQNLVSFKPWIMNTNFNNIGKSIEEPSFTLTASRRHPYLVNANSSTCPPQTLENPSPSVTSRTHLLINPSWFGHASSTDEPSCTIIARQDKAPLYLLAADHGPVAWVVFDDDSETMVKIKEFMVLHNITDIKMRMLKIPELLQIQGFPKDYKLVGTQTEQKKYIGNAVEVNMARAIITTNTEAIHQHLNAA